MRSPPTCCTPRSARRATLVAVLVAVAALASINATMIVGARSAFAAGRNWPALARLGRWDARRDTPALAMLAQGAGSLALVAAGRLAGGGFRAMVEFTAPVFWLFFLLTGFALIVLRRREPAARRPFKVPGYPWVPLAFCASCATMLWSSLSYVHGQAVGGFSAAWIGVAVLATGGLVLAVLRREGRAPAPPVQPAVALLPSEETAMNAVPVFDRRRALAATLLLPCVACAREDGKPAPALDVHYVPTPMPVVDKMLEMARVRRGETLFDLGCGDGRIVVAAAKRHGARGIGIDLDPVRIDEERAPTRYAGVQKLRGVPRRQLDPEHRPPQRERRHAVPAAAAQPAAAPEAGSSCAWAAAWSRIRSTWAPNGRRSAPSAWSAPWCTAGRSRRRTRRPEGIGRPGPSLSVTGLRVESARACPCRAGASVSRP